METFWINRPPRLKWHPPEVEYYYDDSHRELLEFFMERNWMFNRIPQPRPPKIYRGVIVSIAGSGTEPWEDRLFNVSLLGFDCDKFGYVYQYLFNLDEWENPRRVIPREQLEFMRLTETAYRNRTFPTRTIEQLVNTADFIVMYNAREKRRILEARFPVFKTKTFVCLKHDIHWHPLRGVPPEASHLEYFAFMQGKALSLRRPAQEALLIGWLLTLENPRFKGQTSFWEERPSLLQEITNLVLEEYARIFIDGTTVTVPLLLLRSEGYQLDPDTNVWHLDVPMWLRYQAIQRIQALIYNGENHPVAWIPMQGPARPVYESTTIIPTEEERFAAISRLPISTLLHTAEDFLGVVPRSNRVRYIYERVGLSVPPHVHKSEDPHF